MCDHQFITMDKLSSITNEHGVNSYRLLIKLKRDDFVKEHTAGQIRFGLNMLYTWWNKRLEA